MLPVFSFDYLPGIPECQYAAGFTHLYTHHIRLIYFTHPLLFKKLAWHSGIPGKNQKRKPVTRITIIIPARNEEENIGTCLSSICNQSYPKELFVWHIVVYATKQR